MNNPGEQQLQQPYDDHGYPLDPEQYGTASFLQHTYYQHPAAYQYGFHSNQLTGGDAQYSDLEYPQASQETSHTSFTQNWQHESYNNNRSSHFAAQPPPQQPLAPSPDYLAKSLEPSTHTQEPTRKLIILDLNGTLVFRPRPKPPPRSSDPFQPTHRITYTRPYLSSYRSYLFHPETRKWLDVMVWSAAQPHSVKDMLEICFPDDVDSRVGEKDVRFAAVWARDTLGLSSVDYSRKTQTTKDLDKVWHQVSVPLLPSPSITPHELQSIDAISPVQEFHHSLETTLLLDDSPLKAHLQPWNHICIKEYDALARETDLNILKVANNISPEQNNGDVLMESTDKFGTETDLKNQTYTSVSGSIDANDSKQEVDSTLIAVIGILETLKHQSNVARWLRDKGLWIEDGEDLKIEQSKVLSSAPAPAPAPTPATPPPPPPPYIPPSSLSYSEAYEMEIPGLLFSNQGMKRPLDDAAAITSKGMGIVEDTLVPVPTLPSISPLTPSHSCHDITPAKTPPLPSATQSEATITSPSQLDPASVSVTPLSPQLSSAHLLNPLTRESISTVQSHSPGFFSPLPQPLSDSTTQVTSPAVDATFWFSHLPSYMHWLQKGRETLKRLAIKEEAGVGDDDEVEGNKMELSMEVGKQ